MCKEEFFELPTWKQTKIKKAVGLFWSTVDKPRALRGKITLKCIPNQRA
jgi:hypothetical protein